MTSGGFWGLIQCHPMNAPTSKFITCRCRHCNKGIEFDASDFQKGETRNAVCPHCHLETILFVPANSKPPEDKPVPPITNSFKGTLLDYSIQTNKGIISGDNGQRYSFQGSDWKEVSKHPTKGDRVDFIAVGQTASEIYEIAGTQSSPAFASTHGKRPTEYQGFYRSSDEKTLGGVCGGLAHKTGFNRSGWQIIFVFLSLLWLMGVVVYIVMWVGFKALPTKGIKFSD